MTENSIDLDALEKLADEATPGPWNYEGTGYTDDGAQYREVTSSAEVIFGEWGVPSEENAAFIAAANPATIKALIAELKEARGLLAILDDHLGDDDGMWSDDSSISTEWIGSNGIRRTLTFGQFRRIRAFLARNGKGEG